MTITTCILLGLALVCAAFFMVVCSVAVVSILAHYWPAVLGFAVGTVLGGPVIGLLVAILVCVLR